MLEPGLRARHLDTVATVWYNGSMMKQQTARQSRPAPALRKDTMTSREMLQLQGEVANGATKHPAPAPLIPVRLTPCEVALICGALARTRNSSALVGRLAARVAEFSTRRSN